MVVVHDDDLHDELEDVDHIDDDDEHKHDTEVNEPQQVINFVELHLHDDILIDDEDDGGEVMHQ